MTTSPLNQVPNWWKPVWELVIHVLVGSGLFALVFAPAIGLDLVIRWIKEETLISEFLATLLTWTKVVVAVTDAGLYVVFILRMAWLFIIQIWGTQAREHV